MNVLLLSDTHGSRAALEEVKRLHRGPGLDLVCISGDFTGGGAHHESLFGFMADSGITCAFVSGNCEAKKVCERAAARYGFHYLDYGSKLVEGLLIVGIAGFDIFSEKRTGRITGFAKESFDFEGSRFSLLLTHQPPEPWSYAGREVGSAGLRQFTEGKPFDLVVSGHFHEKEPRLETGAFGIPVLNPSTSGCLVEIDAEGGSFRMVSPP